MAPVVDGDEVEVDEPGQGVLVHGVNVGEVCRAEEEKLCAYRYWNVLTAGGSVTTRSPDACSFFPAVSSYPPKVTMPKSFLPSSKFCNWSSMFSLILYFAYLHFLCTSP